MAAALALVAMFTTPALSAADEARVWLASSGSEPATGTNWGRLTLRDGLLRFASNDTEWQLALTEIRRVAISRHSDRLLEIEGAAGEIYYLTIYGQQMLVESPRKAQQIIQQALRPAASRRE